MPKIYDCVQGSNEWLGLRLGIPTASEFHKILTKGGKFSEQARKYAYRLVAEKLLNRSLESLDHIEAIQYGKRSEPEAVKWYEAIYEQPTKSVGFITTNDGRFGASPDRLIIGKNAGLEIKCPYPTTMVEYMVDGLGVDYWPQVQGQILIGEFDYVERYAWSAEMPHVLTRTDRDDEYIWKMKDALDRFYDMKEEMLMKARAYGAYAERQRPTDALDELFEELKRD